jgi:hypothetical protein
VTGSRSREEPERIEEVDPAEECNALVRRLGEAETQTDKLFYHLMEVLQVVDKETWQSLEVRRALECLKTIDLEKVQNAGLLQEEK